ncbi:MAG: type II toxin-antitoxin system PrlF family antitoxin [Chloroflexi bacterium]|nr:type II toxin-antitoxin system PrlF family antitoxin [Chloroflexota bacterium]
MKEYTATTTQRNQVTIPAAVRRLLGIKPRDKVAFTIDDAGTVRLAAAQFTLESAYGSVRPTAQPEDFEQLSRDAKDEKAMATARELRGE